METIKDILMKRDGLTSTQADEQIREAQKAFHDLILEGDLSSALNICEDHFGLEPDYLDELVF